MYPYLRMNNATADGHLDLNDLTYRYSRSLKKCVVRKGDVLFNRTNSLILGKTAVFGLPEDMIIDGYIHDGWLAIKEKCFRKFYLNT